MRVIFDIECVINYFLVVIMDIETLQKYVFEISEFKDQRKELKEFCKNIKLYYGINNRDYDCPMLELALRNGSNLDLYNLSKKLVGVKEDEDESLSKHKVYTKLPHIDLSLVNSYNYGGAKASNLKKLAFNYRKYDVYDMPIDFDKPVTQAKTKDFEKYCLKDVDDTHTIYLDSIEKLEIRRDLGKLFDVDVRNLPDPSMVETIFLKALNLKKYDVMREYEEYSEIRVKDLILPYIGEGKFTSLAKEFFNSIVLKPTDKGFVSDDNILYKEYTDDITIKWAMGGVHGVVKPGLYTNDNCIIKTCDGASMYPNFIRNNKIYPRSIGPKLLELYNWFIEERFKYPKGSTLNLGFKLFINLLSGKLKQKYSALYEPKGNIQMVINCQLMITWLADMILEAIPGSRLLMINTDGVEVQIPKDSEDIYNKVCNKWASITKYTLEYNEYKQMCIRDVNNYHAVYTNGKIKRKGCFETYSDIVAVKDYHKNTSMNIVPLALNEYLVNGTDIEEFIRNHKDIFDFFLSEGNKKSPSKEKGEPIFLLTGVNKFDVNEFKHISSRCLRYYASNEGVTLTKEYENLQKSNVHKDTKVTICEKLKPKYKIENFDINYDWYIAEANKILKYDTRDTEETPR